MTERIIGIAYCLVTIIHLVAMAIYRHVRHDFHDPEQAIARMIIWPITDAVWLARKWAIITVVLISCQPHDDYLDSLPFVERVHNGEAIAVVSNVYGIDYRAPEVRWVVQNDPLDAGNRQGAIGVTYDCKSWVWWPSWYDPDITNSIVFAHTAFAHEIAHCALWLYRGDGDPDHSDAEWWGTKDEGWVGGLVGVAMDVLVKRGL